MTITPPAGYLRMQAATELGLQVPGVTEVDDTVDSDLPQTPAEALGILGIYPEDEYPSFVYHMYPMLETIDGETAARYLELNKIPETGTEGTNRKFQRNRVLKHAENIRTGRWKLTHQGIAFRPGDGALIDGQHRLMAIVMVANENPNFSGVLMWVWRGVPADGMAVFDTGKPRTSVDNLTMKGTPNAKHADATLKLLWRYANADFDSKIDPNYWDTSIDSDILVELRDQYPELDAAVKLGRKYAPIGAANKTHDSILIASAVAAGRIIIDRAYPERIEETDVFFDKLLTGSMLTAQDPIQVLRKWGMNQYKATYRARKLGYMHLAGLLKMYRAYREGNLIKGGQMSLRVLEAFPRP